MIERLLPPVSEEDLRSLAQLLVDAVESGAAVSFLSLTETQALDWWRKLFGAPGSGTIVLVARDAEGIVGSVQLHPSWAPNQPHRADIAKLIVHRRGRQRGLGERLMAAVEHEAAVAGYRLLVLDSKRGDAGERLYRRLGWTVAGTIPRYALDTDGTTPHDTVVFYKELPGLSHGRSHRQAGFSACCRRRPAHRHGAPPAARRTEDRSSPPATGTTSGCRRWRRARRR